MEETLTVQPARLHELIQDKLIQAGLKETHADTVAEHLVFADACGIHSHGAVRVDYYAERIAKGGVTLDPQITFERTGASTGIVHGDNGVGQYVALRALEYAIDQAKESGAAIVGVKRISHCGALSYYVKRAAEENLIAISMCQSDPMVVPFGGSENYFGTNPIAFAAPRENGAPVVFDMATTVQAWGKILDARSKNQDIPDTWAVDANGRPTTNPHEVNGLLPMAGPKGFGLMMMVDVLSGMLLGLPFGKNVSSMYSDLTEKRNLGQLFILIDPKRFTDLPSFKHSIETMIEELHDIAPATGFNQVYYPGETNQVKYDKYMTEGIPVAKQVLDYLESDTIHFDQYGKTGSFATK
ncbi:ureidoglycolate dehydrogenase [Enterococcus hulanensis]|uniref:Ureidoglycolate dehydrogenase n=1 Tax=Enterococcus hulanensis TaxID=2559929 RepID=A0ABU3ETI0_9ENTE|nr:ureidoglycolate dehydrogenase [Enterococcus hulanensis]MDT2598163.1 ureidoglycolate dehydrogenase [Enterococcus hulanensis]MDT2608332.1 ureidoglycolate dehydrogenase [Enterococcus hulanensis]MDT2615627.1 ureidoglycolate dehydrogenase [Enterococcus hulanensis]MDT2626402.1 ureidoglycolate dehydrogenase [Enterococcus hulanensis]MDT2654699.1 ureidoglycolate dehydrogenase [Enterococcus hulanensis]